MAIISMPWRTLVEVVELALMIEEKMLVRKQSIMIYHQDFDNDELEDSDDEEKWKPEKR